MDPSACREIFVRLIAEESQALDELSALLEREHGYLAASAIEDLKVAMKQRQACVTRILRVDEERRTLCLQHGRSNDLKGLEQLLRWCDPQGTLAPGWRRCTEAAARAQKQNDRNGALVGARLTHVRDRLGALLDDRRSMNTYGRQGLKATVDSGHILAAEA